MKEFLPHEMPPETRMLPAHGRLEHSDAVGPYDVPCPRAEDFPFDISPVEFTPDVEIYSSGVNVALNRWPSIECQRVDAGLAVWTVPSWKPGWPKVHTVGLAFPEAIEFLPPEEEKSNDQSENIRSKKEKPEGESDAERKRPKKTRLQPPSDALSLEDRLFYILQPPLETMLAGQELIMPFEPFPHQYEGIGWLFSQDSALLADEMGLGKTMQMITAVRLLLRGGQVRRILLVCPKPLIPNWQREFRAWAEELPVVTVEGDTARRNLIWKMPGVPILMTNYEVMVRDMEAMPEEERPKFDLVVLDEAQRIKNRDSKTAIVTRDLKRKRSWCLTGTPIENRPEELVSLFEFLEVVNARANPDLRQLKKLADQHILRRTKDVAMKDMPPRLDRDAYLELSSAQKYAYTVAEKEGVVQLNDMGDQVTIQHVFELVLRLKQITNFDPLTNESSKLDRLVADMEEIAASGGKAILFSQWTKVLDWLAVRLQQFNPLVYHGGVPNKKREPILAKFEEDPSKHILLMSYGTGAVGLNLQFAGYVFLFDRWWNPAVEDQAINRAHRIGQTSTVIVTRFICNDTIEERIDAVLQHKRAIFDSILGDGDVEDASRSLNAAEIFGLFDLKAKHGKGTRKIAPKAIEDAA
jgi:SNF2 family DNA or RNA helicase